MMVFNGFMKEKMVRKCFFFLSVKKLFIFININGFFHYILGWWLYEKRTSEEIEQNFKLNKMKFDLLICGTMYTIDLERNVQFNKENPTRRRKIKRENAENITVKGVAGVH